MIKTEDIIVLHNNKHGERTDPFSESFKKALEEHIKNETKIVLEDYLTLSD